MLNFSMESEKHTWTCVAGTDENADERRAHGPAQGVQGARWGAGKGNIPVAGGGGGGRRDCLRDPWG